MTSLLSTRSADRPRRRVMALGICLLTGGLAVAGGSAFAASPAGAGVEAVAPRHSADDGERKWQPGDPVTSEIADAATLASVPAAPPEAPPAGS